ncbi:MAG: S8 family serine peptidase [candidate division Zixibacteria bacterium]|nr:S8 family serine peptidase [candidate division Zixibacteria bacterium]
MRTLFMAILIGLVAGVVFAEQPLSLGTLETGDQYITDRIIVTVRPGVEPLLINHTISGVANTGNEQIDLLCKKHNVIKVEMWYPMPVQKEILRLLVERMYVFYLSPEKDVMDVKDSFLANDDIECSDPWVLDRLFYTPNDPSIGSQWYINKTDCYGAWDLVRGDTTTHIIIGIDDTGVYYNHPDLQGNMWINGPEDVNGNGIFDAGDNNGVDDDGNGYTDDVVGWDLGMNDNNPQENSPTHGTHVAGCASEATDNATAGAGPGFGAKLMAIKITNAYGQLTHGYQGIIYAINNDVDIINCSWGNNYYSPSNQNTINIAHTAGVLVVAAAGNDNNSTPGYPAAYNYVLSVASTDQDDVKSYFSCYGSWVDVSAPGESIYSTWAQSSYTYLQGTSMASPIVAGIAALVRAQNPYYSPDRISSIIIETTDDIDLLNPNYQGLLGSGRVNAYSAVGASNYPNFQLVESIETLTDDDGDGIINPGESIDLVVELQNLWQDAEDVIVALRAPEGIIVTDSVVEFGSFPGDGEHMDNSDDPFSITYDEDLPPGNHELTLHISTADDYTTDLFVEVNVSLNQINFPISLPDAIASDPLAFDFDIDGSVEILVGCNNAKLYSIESDGSYTPGWPVSVGDDINNAPAVGDINANGGFEVVATDKDGLIYAWYRDGNLVNGFPITTGGSVFAGPTLLDFDGNGDLEIVQPNFSTRNLDVFNHDGTAFGDWPYTSTVGWYGSAAVGDIDGDGSVEIVIAGFDDYLHVFNADKTEVSGFPYELDSHPWVSPVIGNIDPSDLEPEIFIPTQSGSAYLFNHDGSLVSGWPISISSAIKSSPSLADLDDDGTPEIIFGASNSRLYVYDSDGTALDGFPVELLATIQASPVVADLTGDGMPEIIIANGSAEACIFAFDRYGETVDNFPIPLSATGQVNASPAIWDIDDDGDAEIVVGVQNSGENLDVIDYKTEVSMINAVWPVYGNDVHRSNNYVPFIYNSIDEDSKTLPVKFSLNQNYPNPFNAHTIISFNLDISSKISLDIYDILGRQVKSLASDFQKAGKHSIVWDGRNDNNSKVSSGVYFYRLKAGEKLAVKRMVYLR